MYNDMDPETLTINPTELDSNTFVATIDNFSKQIADFTQDKPSNADKALITMYDQMSRKYHLNVEYTDFKQFLEGITDKDKLTSAFEEVVGNKIIEQCARRVRVNAIVTVSNMIERALKLMDSQSENAYEPSFDMVVYIDKVMQWVDQLNKMEENSKRGDPDRSLQSISDKINKVSSFVSIEDKRKEEAQLNNLKQAIVNNETSSGT